MLKEPLHVKDRVEKETKQGSGLSVWTAASEVTIQRVPPLKRMRQIVSGEVAGSFTMICASSKLPGYRAAFSFRSPENGVTALEKLQMHVRYEPPFPTKLGAPITEMAATLDDTQPVKNEIFKLAGEVEYQLEDGETISDHALTVSVEKSELEKLLVNCANTARQDWYVLVIYN